MKNTHAKTHSNYTVDIVQIFRVSREGEAERFKKVMEYILMFVAFLASVDSYSVACNCSVILIIV